MSNTHDKIQEQWRELLNEVARSLDGGFNPGKYGKDRKWGFVLLLFPFGEPDARARINYISNAERADMIVAMKEFIARNEGRFTEPETKTPQ